MYEVMPNDTFGEVAYLDGGHTPLRFVAVTQDTIVLLLPVDVVRTVVERLPDAGRRQRESFSDPTSRPTPRSQ